MSDWGDELLDGVDAQPFEPPTDDWADFDQMPVESSSPVTRAQDLTDPAILAARAHCDKAEQTLRATRTALVAGEDSLADSIGQSRVAEIKLSEVSEDESSKRWQVAAAEEDHAKKVRAQARAAAAIEQLKKDVQAAEQSYNEAQQLLTQIIKSINSESAPNDEEDTLVYGSADEFYREFLRNAYRRQISGRGNAWDAKWWNYAEAVIRIDALWRSWETLRKDPSTGMSVWFRDHADHHMAVLMDDNGPFASADRDDEKNKCRKGEPLPYEPPPEGLFKDERTK